MLRKVLRRSCNSYSPPRSDGPRDPHGRSGARGPGSCHPAAPQPLGRGGEWDQTPPSPGLPRWGGPEKSPFGRQRPREAAGSGCGSLCCGCGERGGSTGDGGRREGMPAAPAGQPWSGAPPRRSPRAASVPPARPSFLLPARWRPVEPARKHKRHWHKPECAARWRQPAPPLSAQVPGFWLRWTCPRIHVSSLLLLFYLFLFFFPPLLLGPLPFSPPHPPSGRGRSPRRRGRAGRCSAGPGEGVAGHLPAGKRGLGLAACLCVCALLGEGGTGAGGCRRRDYGERKV